jgi:hypothetical protein
LDIPFPNQWLYEIYAPHTYADVRIDARVELGAGGPGAAGVICRYDRGGGWYEFNVYADQTYTLLFGQWLAEGIARYTPLVVSESEEITPSVNEIGLVCQGDILTPYVNGVQLRRRQETLHVLSGGLSAPRPLESAPLVIPLTGSGDGLTDTRPAAAYSAGSRIYALLTIFCTSSIL